MASSSPMTPEEWNQELTRLQAEWKAWDQQFYERLRRVKEEGEARVAEERARYELKDRGSLVRESGPPAEGGSPADRLDRIERSLASMAKDVGQLKQDVGQLKQDVGQLKQDVGQLKQDVGQLKQDVGQLKQDVGQLKQDVADIKLQIREQLVTKVEFEGLAHNIAVMGDGYKATQERLDVAIDLLKRNPLPR
jgi:chromosome segregation ATPase